MRILQVIHTLDPEAGGPSEAIRQMIRHYKSTGNEGEVLCLDDPGAHYLRDLKFCVHALGPVPTTYAFTPRLVPWLRANLHRYDGVIVHGLWQYIGLAVMRAVYGKKPYAVFTHGMLDPYFKHAFPLKHIKKWLYWMVAEYWVLRRANRVLFTSKAEMDLAAQSFWLHQWHGEVVPYGADSPPLEPAIYRAAFVAQFPRLEGKRFLLFLGRIHPKKGCDLLIEAFARLADRDPGLHLVLAGPDQKDWIAKLSAVAQSAGIADRVHWLGMVGGLMKWGAFYSSEAFVLPSHQENFGIAVAEALACGKPVLISDKVNIWEPILQDGAAIVAPDTAEGTLQLLEQWLALSPQQRDAMAENAYRCFHTRYDMKENTKVIVRIFSEIASLNTKPDATKRAAG